MEEVQKMWLPVELQRKVNILDKAKPEIHNTDTV